MTATSPALPSVPRLLLVACCGLLACARQVPTPAPSEPTGGPQATSARRETFPELVDAVFAAAFDFSPSNATAYGLHAYDTRLEDLSRPRIEARIRWAHYTEQMMLDQGYGNGDPKLRLAQLSEALLRDCRYVTGIKLHTAGWTVEDGARLFREKCFQQPSTAYEEARRGAYNPTYLYYTFGKLEVQRLARDYTAKGASLKQFHNAFVAQGSLPLPLVRRLLLR